MRWRVSLVRHPLVAERCLVPLYFVFEPLPAAPVTQWVPLRAVPPRGSRCHAMCVCVCVCCLFRSVRCASELAMPSRCRTGSPPHSTSYWLHLTCVAILIW
ncbi:hypothetical protein TRVL_08472 [Trypanosoma vivax]|nr:hypothetical protein TRVL_08472 [Trypanosoma vivax]